MMSDKDRKIIYIHFVSHKTKLESKDYSIADKIVKIIQCN